MVRVMRQPGREVSYWSKNGPTRSLSKSAAVIGVFWSGVETPRTAYAPIEYRNPTLMFVF